MKPVFRFLFLLLLGLAALTWCASALVDNTTRKWFEKDMVLRAQLAVSGARQVLLAAWSRSDEEAVLCVLEEITRDDRILGSATYDARGRIAVHTGAYPVQVSGEELAIHVRPAPDSPAPEWKGWDSVHTLSGGSVHVTAIPFLDGEKPLGFVVLLHDMSFVDRRSATTRKFVFVSFAVLASTASVLTLLAARVSWRSWNEELRRFLRGGKERPEFRPLLRDVRDLMERVSSERETELAGRAWTSKRLKEVLERHLHGERIVLLANREPYMHVRSPEGRLSVLRPASGLVTALEPVLRACSGVWIAHGSGSADAETADTRGRLRVPPGEESYTLRRIWLSPEEEQGYYYGFSNEGLWPLCHIAHTRPVFRTEDWQQYKRVNQKFADSVMEEVDDDDPIVLVQDYHFALAPSMIRERLPRATILTFWHIPWPNAESFGICPWREDILQGLLGSSILGFHTTYHCNNFLEGVDRFLEARLDRERILVVHQGRTTRVRAYPISVDWPSGEIEGVPAPDRCRAELFEELRLAPDALLGVGVDRMDYTKGIEEKFLAVERALERFPDLQGRFTFLQIAAPTRSKIERYQQLARDVETLAHRVNERFGRADYRPIVLYQSHRRREEVYRVYRAADVCYVSSLHDGMNLVAKEFVAARSDGKGVLVLSHFTGAARELAEALIVNPYDLDEASAALGYALRMPLEEQRERMRSLRLLVAEFNVFRWAGRMLEDAGKLRKRDRIASRLMRRRTSLEGWR